MDRRGGYRQAAGDESGGVGNAGASGGGAATWVTIAAFLVVGGIAAALTLGVITFEHQEKPGIGYRICNTGSNLNTSLPWCPVNGTSVGETMVAGNRSLKETSVVKRIVGRYGVNATSVDETVLMLDANLVSLSPEIVLAHGPSIGDPVTLTFVPSPSPAPTPGGGVDQCTVSCDEDYRLSIENGDSGYGMVMGFNLTMSPAGSNANAAMFGGESSLIMDSPGAVMLGGVRSRIEDADASGIVASVDSVVNMTNSHLVACRGCGMYAAGSSIGFSEISVVTGSSDRQLILGGFVNEISATDQYNTIIGGDANSISGRINYNTIIGSSGCNMTGFIYQFMGIISSLRSVARNSFGLVLIGTKDVNVNGVSGSVVLGQGLPASISGARYDQTAISKNLALYGGISIAGFYDLAGGRHNAAPGEHMYLGGTVATTLDLPQPSQVPDGYSFIVRDKGDLSAFPVTLSCLFYSCTICPKGGACTAAGGTHVINTQYAAETYYYHAATTRWYGV